MVSIGSLIIFAGVFNALVGICFAWYSFRNINSSRLIWIIMLLFCILIIQLEQIVRISNLISVFPHILFISTPLFFLYPALILNYQLESGNRRVYLNLIIPFLVLILMIPTYSMPRGDKIEMYSETGLTDPVWLIVLFVTYWFVYSLFSYRENREHRRGILNESADNRIDNDLLSNDLISLVGLFGLIFPIYMVVQYFDLSKQDSDVIKNVLFVAFSMTSHITVFSLFLSKSKFQISQTLISTGQETPAPTPELLAKCNELTILIKTRSLYLNRELSLTDLATEIGWTRSKVSTVINGGLKKNFYDYINEFRIDEVILRIKNQEHLSYSLDHLVKECGFNSYTSFYRIFRRFKAQTPSQYIRSQEDNIT